MSQTARLKPLESTAIDHAKDVLLSEARSLEQVATAINGDFLKAVTLIQSIKGRLIVSGIGKSGHIARKIAATMASTGQPAFFVHAAEASHGDLGMITSEDALLVLSSSGETQELKPLMVYARRFAIPVIGITKNPASALAAYATVALILPEVPEACPMGLAPTTSTIMMLGLGDALAVCLLKAKAFSPKDYSLFHPGGSLGEQLTTVGDKMHEGREIPLAPPSTSMEAIVQIMTDKKFGCIGIVDEANVLLGIITDGDLRRSLTQGKDLMSLCARDIMKSDPITITKDILMADALRLLQEKSITSLFIINEEKKPIGLIHIHDFLKSGVL